MRITGSLALALLINGFIFFLMQALLTGRQYVFNDIKTAQIVDFVRAPATSEQQTPPRRMREAPEPPPTREIRQHTATKAMRRGTANVRSLPLPLSMLEIEQPLVSNSAFSTGPYLPSVLAEGAPGQTSGGIPGAPDIGDFIPASDLVPIIEVRPEYPEKARYRHIEGHVLVEFTVNEQGRVEDPVVIESEPPKVFDRAVLAAARRARFQPKKENGRAIAVRVRQRLNFHLRR